MTEVNEQLMQSLAMYRERMRAITEDARKHTGHLSSVNTQLILLNGLANVPKMLLEQLGEVPNIDTSVDKSACADVSVKSTINTELEALHSELKEAVNRVV